MLRFVRFFAFTATAAFTGTVSAQESVPNLSPNTAPSTLAYWKLADGAGNNRNSWDPSCVFTAVRGLAGVWKAQTGGSLTITDAKADDLWVNSPVKNQLYLVQYSDPSVIAATLEQLITAPPKK